MARMVIFAALAFWSAVSALGGGASQSSIALTVDIASPLGTMPHNMSGFGWEMWQFLGTYQSQLNSSIYRTIARGVGGATLRLGGISADFTTYEIGGREGAAAAEVLSPVIPMGPIHASGKPANFWPNYTQPLTSSTFLSLLDFLSQANMRLLLDLNELNGRNCHANNPNCPNPGRCPEWCVGAWNTSNLQGFLQWLHDQHLFVPRGRNGDGGSTLIGFELGNELTTHLDAEDNVEDIKRLVGLVQAVWSDVPPAARPPVFAPSTAKCDIADTHAIMDNITGVANAFTFHAYPGGPCPNGLAEFVLNATWLRTGIMTGSDAVQCLEWWNAGPRARGLGLWITEASACYDYQLPPPAQNSFIHGFFTIPELGQYAASGVGMVGRWSFGAQTPFGLIVMNSTRGEGLWDVAADYFLLNLFNHTRSGGSDGTPVLSVTGDEGSSALVYAHCASGSAAGAGAGSITLMAVNPGNATVSISGIMSAQGVAIPTVPRQEYVLTAPGGDLASLTPVLNGHSVLRIKEDGSMPAMPPVRVTGGTSAIELPPLSQAFFVLLGAGAAVCH